jgi:CheY-like chemotaxis protein
VVKFALNGSQVNYRVDLAGDLSLVEADEGQILQVMQNVVLNAAQAMPEGGTVTVTARNISAPCEGTPPSLVEGPYVEIAIQDMGIGIPPENLPKIFDPYFTTKAMGSEKGTGLGLTTSLSIIKAHSGGIAVSSKPGEGSTFLIFLPAGKTEAVDESLRPKVAEPKKGKILVMDNEETIRDVVRGMLEAQKWEVEVAKTGEEAIEMCRLEKDKGKPFDLVIFDLTVKGGMGAEQAIKELREIVPGIKAVVSSGYVESPVVSNYQAHGFVAFLIKPFRIAELNRCISDLLMKDSGKGQD